MKITKPLTSMLLFCLLILGSSFANAEYQSYTNTKQDLKKQIEKKQQKKEEKKDNKEMKKKGMKQKEKKLQ